ncbi:MAG: AcvB/VirJ family lysyl-phosphatidylglycerol hydrolase [Ilyomonas sp.]
MTSFSVKAQQATPVAGLPLATYAASTNDTSKPVIVYYTGDGGFNSFSTSFAKQLNSKGYNIVSFNSLKYFWRTKTPEQAAADAIQVIEYAQKTYNRKRFVLIGYSFGADVMPFIFNRLPKRLQVDTKYMVLMSPSTHTDFTVHVTELLGRNNKGSSNIPEEINKITGIPLLIVAGEKEEGGLNTSSLTIPNIHKLIIPGGHHYDSDPSFVVNTIINYLH